MKNMDKLKTAIELIMPTHPVTINYDAYTQHAGCRLYQFSIGNVFYVEDYFSYEVYTEQQAKDSFFKYVMRSILADFLLNKINPTTHKETTMKIETKFNIGDIVFHKLDTSLDPLMIVGILIRDKGSVVYEATNRYGEKEYYEIELTQETNSELIENLKAQQIING